MDLALKVADLLMGTLINDDVIDIGCRHHFGSAALVAGTFAEYVIEDSRWFINSSNCLLRHAKSIVRAQFCQPLLKIVLLVWDLSD